MKITGTSKGSRKVEGDGQLLPGRPIWLYNLQRAAVAVLLLSMWGAFFGGLSLREGFVSGGATALASVASSPSQVENTPGIAGPGTGNHLSLQVKSAYMLDVRTGRVLYAFNENERIQPASLVKMLTLTVVLEALKDKRVALEDQVPISEKAWRLSMDQGVSRMFIEVGNKVKLEDLLYGLMVSSGNDAAVALAEHLAGTEESFAGRLNAMVEELGLNDTRLANSHGLEAPNQYSTAREMALLARYLVLEHPEALKYTSTKSFTFNGITQQNWNKLLFRDERVNGIKTGHLTVSGYHLAATARDGEEYLAAVVMGSPNEETRLNETHRLLNWGFNNFVTVTVPVPSDLPLELPVYKGRAGLVKVKAETDLLVTVPRGEDDKLTVAVKRENYLVAPVEAGRRVGEITISTPQGTAGRFELLTTEEVSRGGFFRVAWDSLRLFLRNLFNKESSKGNI